MTRYRLPLPPSSNKYWRYNRGKVHVSEEAVDYRYTVKMLMRCSSPPPTILSGPVALELHVYRERRSGDLSNRIKIVEDSLQGVLYINDSQVIELRAFLHEDRHDPRIEVEVVSCRTN